MDYAHALDWLYGRQRFGMKLGLETTRDLLARLGDPQNAFPALHVTGTNGKGSVCAYLDAALHAHGMRTGLYTSPHLVNFTERIVVAGEPVAPETVGRLVDRVRPHVEALDARRTPPTYFECVTAMAFEHFRDAKVQAAVVEVGMGGRLDATNVCQPVVSAITNVGLDHTDRLGTSVQAIAAEKAGILRPGIPAVTGTRREALDVIVAAASRLKAPLKVARAKDDVQESWDGITFRHPWRGEMRSWQSKLLGEHQAQNIAIALGVLEQAPAAWALDPEKIAQGVAQAEWPGRLEVVRRDPIALLDGAHNPPAMEALAGFLERMTPQGAVAACVGVLRDKAASTMLRALSPRITRWVITRSPNARTLGAQELAEVLPADAAPHVVETEPTNAFRALFAGPEPVKVITGSLFLVGEARAQLLRLERDPSSGGPRTQ